MVQTRNKGSIKRIMEDVQMKKFIIVLILMMIVPTVAYATEFESAPTIAAAYAYWANAFGAEDVSWESNTKDDELDEKLQRLYVDDIVIDYSLSIPDGVYFQTKQVVLFVNAHDGSTSIAKQARALALFAALEYGAPSTFDNAEIDAAYAVAQSVFNEYALAMVSNTEKLFSKELVLFRMNKHGRYYLAHLDSVGFCIMVQ